MKVSITALFWTLMVLLFSDWTIKGTQGIKCTMGLDCKGVEHCRGEGVEGGWKSTDCDDTRGCEKRVYVAKKDGKVGITRGCKLSLEIRDCDALKKKHEATVDIICYSCNHTDNCNAAPNSAQGLGLFMMTAALATVVILGM